MFLISFFLILGFNAGGAYFKSVYSLSLSEEAVQSVFHANTQEIGSNFDHKIWLWIFFLAIVPTIFLYFFSKKHEATVGNWLFSNVVSFILIILLVCGSIKHVWHIQFYEKSLSAVMPYNYLIGLARYLKHREFIYSQKDNNFIIEQNEQHNDLKFVVIIGESARSDHFSLNGYHLNTNPILSKVDNLINYSNAYALATYTIGGVQNIFKHDVSKNHFSLIKLMEQNNFNTFWFSNHRYEDDIVTSIATEAQTNAFRDNIIANGATTNFDEVLIPYLDKALKEKSNENAFIVLHSFGSHYSYDLRYPDEFLQFSPTCKEEHSFFGRTHCNNIVKIRNAYDNSILYTDYFIAQVIETLKNYNAVLLYISDHGESLGENGIYYHTTEYAHAPKEQLHVPMLVWASDRFLQNPINLKNFNKLKLQKDNKVDQSYIFHTIPHCLGFDKNINKELSLCK